MIKISRGLLLRAIKIPWSMLEDMAEYGLYKNHQLDAFMTKNGSSILKVIFFITGSLNIFSITLCSYLNITRKSIPISSKKDWITSVLEANLGIQ